MKWRLWHGQADRAISGLEKIITDLVVQSSDADVSAKRLLDLAQLLLTYIRSSRSAIVDYGARYRSGRRIPSSLAESAVGTLVAGRMVKKQQMQWSLHGAHRMLQVRSRTQRRLDGPLGLAASKADTATPLGVDV